MQYIVGWLMDYGRSCEMTTINAICQVYNEFCME